MDVGGSIFLIALGAILTWAVTATVAGIDIAVVGVILMLAGGLGLLLSLTVWGPARRSAGGAVVERHTVVDREVL